VTPPITFNRPYVTDTERAYLDEVLRTRRFAGNGPFTERVQRLLETRFGVPHVLLTHSCTGALELAALRLDLGPGDEVIVPSYTFAATASAFLRTGATIVFCDVDPTTMNLDPADVANRVTDRTKAVIPVHYGGIGARMDEIMAIAAEHDLAVVEDAAQGLAAAIGEDWLGTIAPLGAVSFHETKNLHSGLGGALFVNDPVLFDRAEDMWERGTNRTKMFKGLVDKYTWVEPGSSFYPSELQAAFLLAQLEHLDDNLAERRTLYQRYDAGLRTLEADGRFALPRVSEDRRLNWHSYFLIANSASDADAIRDGLSARDIQAYIGYVPLHSSPMGRKLGYAPDDVPVTEELAPRVLRLPFHNDLTLIDIDRVIEAIDDLTKDPT
jgi:dTDP-4-amino-4,6-dideoxygalactose transaminase